MEADQYPTPEILEGILASLLSQHPDAAIAAVNADSRPVPMPVSISLAGRPNGPYRHAFALVDPDDRGKVIEAWDSALARGASSTAVHLANATRDAAILCFVDARRAHGVYLRFLALTGGDGSVAAADKVPVLPARSSSIHKNPMSFITAIDSATTSMLGWPAEEIIGRRSLDFIHPDDHQRAIDNWMDLITGSGSKRYRARHLRKDGSWVWLELTNHNRVDDPNVAAIVTEMVDVSEEMAVQEELRAQHQLLHRLAEALPLGLLQVVIGRLVVYTNDRFHQIVGVDRATTLAEQAATVVPDDQMTVSDAFDTVLDLGFDGDIEVRLQLPSRELRQVTMSLRALTSDNGTVTGVIVAVADVTESSRLRAKLEDRATYDSLTRCYKPRNDHVDARSPLGRRPRTGRSKFPLPARRSGSRRASEWPGPGPASTTPTSWWRPPTPRCTSPSGLEQDSPSCAASSPGAGPEAGRSRSPEPRPAVAAATGSTHAGPARRCTPSGRRTPAARVAKSRLPHPPGENAMDLQRLIQGVPGEHGLELPALGRGPELGQISLETSSSLTRLAALAHGVAHG